MKLRYAIVVLGIAVAVSGCQPRPELTKRYAQSSGLSSAADGADITITSTSTDPPAPLRFTALPDRAMQEYISQLGQKIKDPKEFRAALAKPIVAPLAAKEFDDQAVLARNVAVTIAHSVYRPADRFARLRVQIEPINFAFRDYTLVESEFATFKLGTIHFEKTNNIGGELGIDLKGIVLGSTKLTGSAERKTTEDIALEERIEKLTFNFQPDKVALTRQGATGIDLAGNTLISVSVQPKNLTFEHVVTGADLFDDKGAAKSGAQAALTREWVRIPVDRGADLKAKVSASYVLRHVNSGDDTVMEGDDNAQFIETTQPPVEQVLVSKEELAAPRWVVQIADGPCANRLVTSRDLGMTEALSFTSPFEAENFARWLRMRGLGAIGGMQLGCFGAAGFSTPNANRFQVRVSRDY